MTGGIFLPGVPIDHVVARLAAAAGDEIGSGKLAHPESSAALAVNTFGWFVGRPQLLPPLPGLEQAGEPTLVDVEFCARFPWSGGRHPWLDAVVETDTTIIGVEPKRFEPFRDAKKVALSASYDRPVWGDRMTGFERMRDRLRSGEERFEYLDAAQPVKHAFGLRSERVRKEKLPTLFYLFAEPKLQAGQPITSEQHRRHRAEVERFAKIVEGDEVIFLAASYRDWLDYWLKAGGPVVQHAETIKNRFAP